MYAYKMIQVPPNIAIAAKGMFKKAPDPTTVAADYLQAIVNNEAQQGWEFHRIDVIGVRSDPGCIASLLGQKSMEVNDYVVTFRRQA